MHAYACTHHTHVHIYIHPHIHMQTRHTHTHTHTQTYLFIINFSFCHLSIVKLIPLESVGPRLPEGGGIQTSVSCHWCVLIGDFLLMDQSHSLDSVLQLHGSPRYKTNIIPSRILIASLCSKHYTSEPPLRAGLICPESA